MRTSCVVLAAMGLAAGVASARPQMFFDSSNDLFDNGFAHLDIQSVTLSNDASNLHATIQVRGDVAATNWGKYLFMLDTIAAPAGRADNPWGRNIDTSGRLNDVYIGSWVDQNPDSFAQIWQDVGGWTQTGQVTVDRSQASAGQIGYTFPLASLGLAVGQTFYFDVMTTGGSDHDPGVDHLSNLGMATPGWGDTSHAGPYLAYTVVPGPGAMALLGVAGLMGIRRRR